MRRRRQQGEAVVGIAMRRGRQSGHPKSARSTPSYDMISTVAVADEDCLLRPVSVCVTTITAIHTAMYGHEDQNAFIHPCSWRCHLLSTLFVFFLFIFNSSTTVALFGSAACCHCLPALRTNEAQQHVGTLLIACQVPCMLQPRTRNVSSAASAATQAHCKTRHCQPASPPHTRARTLPHACHAMHTPYTIHLHTFPSAQTSNRSQRHHQ